MKYTTIEQYKYVTKETENSTSYKQNRITPHNKIKTKQLRVSIQVEFMRVCPINNRTY